MRVSKKWGVAAMVLAIGVGGCGDDGGPSGGGDLTDQEKQVLANALAQADDVTGIGAFAGSIVSLINDVGTLNAGTQASIRRVINDRLHLSTSGTAATSYDGVGFAMVYTYDVGGQSYEGFFLGVVGWSGINVSAGTVDELVMVGGFGEGSTLPALAEGAIEDGDVFALYFDGSTAYFGVTGSASASPSFGGSSTDCSQTVEGYTFDCSYTTGSMDGDFEFEASDVAEEQSYTQSPIAFADLPSLRISVVYSDAGR
jgi:hypothetical protein